MSKIIATLKSRSRVNKGQLNVVPFNRLGVVSYQCSIATLTLIRTVFFRYSTSKYTADLEKRVSGPSRSLKIRSKKLMMAGAGLRKKFDDIFSRLDTIHQRDRHP